MINLYTVSLPHGRKAIAARVQNLEDLSIALEKLDLHQARPTIALVGGANNLSGHTLPKLPTFLHTVVVQTAMDLDAVIVDGGTDAGIMQLIGQARYALKAKFPLIGVAPYEKVQQSSEQTTSTALAPHHSHFIFVPGTQWGDESVYLARVATLLSSHYPSITLVINGGEITWRDVTESISARRRTLVVSGSGRTADRLTMAVQGKSNDNAANQLVKTGLIQCIDLESNLISLKKYLKQLLTLKI